MWKAFCPFKGSFPFCCLKIFLAKNSILLVIPVFISGFKPDLVLVHFYLLFGIFFKYTNTSKKPIRNFAFNYCQVLKKAQVAYLTSKQQKRLFGSEEIIIDNRKVEVLCIFVLLIAGGYRCGRWLEIENFCRKFWQNAHSNFWLHCRIS